MTTTGGSFDDNSSLRRHFLQAVVSARFPIRARQLAVPGLDRRTVQKRLERLRQRAGGSKVSDEEVVRYARAELSRLDSPLARGISRLEAVADPLARDFAQRAALQALVIGDWVELSHSPGDRGWTREEISVQEMPRKALFRRGKAELWIQEKKAYLRKCWLDGKEDSNLKRNLTPNHLKMDLAGFLAMGTRDSPRCAIQVAPIDWLTCFSLNSRLDSATLIREEGDVQTVRERWGEPDRVVKRQGLPGMLVAHIVVQTVDERFLVCQRQSIGVQDEPGTWSVSVEERWSAGRDDSDAHPHDVVRRALHEELGIAVSDSDIRVLSWGIESSVLYPGFIAVARTSAGSWEIEGLRAHASDAGEIRFVSSVPAHIESAELLNDHDFAPQSRPELRRRWHRTSKARLFTALASVWAREGLDRSEILSHLGGSSR